LSYCQKFKRKNWGYFSAEIELRQKLNFEISSGGLIGLKDAEKKWGY
jgi:hypothetical protein